MHLQKFCEQARKDVEKMLSYDDGINQLEDMEFLVLMAKHYFCHNLAMEHIWGEYNHITKGTPKSDIPHYENVHGSYNGNTKKSYSNTLTDEQMKAWVDSMKNEDGTIGEHWSLETTTNAGKKLGMNFNEVSPMCFYVVMNKMYSDCYSVAVKYNVNTVEYYFDQAKAFIFDKDSVPIDEKLAVYYNHIMKK